MEINLNRVDLVSRDAAADLNLLPIDLQDRSLGSAEGDQLRDATKDLKSGEGRQIDLSLGHNMFEGVGVQSPER